jgi:hypothetical protein
VRLRQRGQSVLFENGEVINKPRGVEFLITLIISQLVKKALPFMEPIA